MSSLKELASLRIPLDEIVLATNDFAHENLIGQGGLGKVYKGNLLLSQQVINVAVRRLDRKYGHGVAEFWTDILMLSSLKHENLVSIVGFCDENHEKIIVYKHEVHGSLDKYLSDPNLTWIRRLQICVGIARALSYIHYDVGRGYSMIHRNIKSSKILLDDNWEAKVSGFGLSMKNSAARRHRLLLTRLSGTVGYVDPAYEKTGGVTHKSDVFSFGVVLFEVLCGRKAFIPNKDNEFLAQLAKIHYEERKLDDMIDSDLRKQMDIQSFNIFSETAYCCLKEQRAQRPNMDQIAKRLEKAWELQWIHENPEHSTLAVEGISSNHWKKNLEHLKIPLVDIEIATENFAKTYCIGSGGYGIVYKAEIDHFDDRNYSAIEGKNEGELPKRRSTVAIKRIFSREDGQGEQGFFAEVEMLTSCKHPNIVSLLGFCDEGPQMILVYEHASNGSLDDYLGSTDSMITLTWAQRLKMCLDIAHGLNYLHTRMEDKQRIIHRDIKSANILLGENWEAKIADFGLSKFHPTNQYASSLDTYNIAGTEVYLDPEYMKTGKLKKESDIYSFGVVLFEILYGRLAYDEIYIVDDDKGLPSIIRQRFKEGTLKDMVDPNIKEETDVNKFSLNKGPDQDSLDTFSKIGFQCLAETQAERPTMEVIIKELEKALYFQENHKDILRISLEDIKLATGNFNDNNSIGRGGFAKIYKGEVPHASGRTTIVAKRFDRSLGQGEHEFLIELEILFEYKHENIIGLVGYCNEKDEKIIVSEYASNGSLDRYLGDVSLTWMQRLKICIDVASVLDFLHGGVVTQERVIHRDIKSSNILLNGDWKAKLSDFGLSLISPINHEMEYVIDNVAGTIGYLDPLYRSTSFLTKESDIYSFGVVLYEILCGRLAVHWDTHNYERRSLTNIVKRSFKEGKHDEIVFEGIKEQIVPNSLAAFQLIAYQCLHDDRENRPTAGEVVLQLKKALEFQEDYEIWEPKLPRDYIDIISRSGEIYSTESKKDLYNMFSKGILLQEGKVWFYLGNNGERSEMISARTFSYKNRRSCKWRSFQKSRFQKVAEMLDISNLHIQIKIRTQLLSPGVNYGVHLVFKFCNPRKFSSRPMYVNLKYKLRKENLHAYFATWRDDEWMMIELCRFMNHKGDTDFEVLLESFSRYYCGNGGIYVEGIEFQAIDNVKHEEIKKLEKVQSVMKSNSKMDVVQQLPTDYEENFNISKNYGKGEQSFSLSEMNGKKHLTLSAMTVVFDFSNMKLLNSEHSTLSSRFKEVIELQSQQVFRIKYKIENQTLSPDTDYVCYLVFKLSEKCRGLHCPVKVRDLLHRSKKETGILYFRFPSPWNLHANNCVPKHRGDGWMEVNLWRFNSNYGLKNSCLSMDLKMISYEGTMSGLIVCGLDFRPM